MTKLYIVVADDLTPGQQSAQAVHCAYEFQREHSEIHSSWYDQSNTIVILTAPPERLKSLLFFGETVSHFREPDFDDKLTAIALAPTEHSASLCSDLPLQGKTSGSRIPRKFFSKITTYLPHHGCVGTNRRTVSDG